MAANRDEDGTDDWPVEARNRYDERRALESLFSALSCLSGIAAIILFTVSCFALLNASLASAGTAWTLIVTFWTLTGCALSLRISKMIASWTPN